MIKAHAVRWSFALDSERVSRAMLEELRDEGRQISLRVIESLSLENDIDPDLARQTIEVIRVRSSSRAPADAS